MAKQCSGEWKKHTERSSRKKPGLLGTLEGQWSWNTCVLWRRRASDIKGKQGPKHVRELRFDSKCHGNPVKVFLASVVYFYKLILAAVEKWDWSGARQKQGKNLGGASGRIGQVMQ